jgi:predicted nucleic acid-binding protein
MDLVVDANVVFAALVKDGATIEILLEPQLQLFSPEFLFEEIFKHRDELALKTKRTEKELQNILEILQEKITIVPKEEFENFLAEARQLCPDPADIPYFALALKMNAPIWSNDKELKEKQKQKQVKIFSTSDLLR